MYVLKCREGRWIEVAHRSGDVLRIRVYDCRSTSPGRLGEAHLAFDDPPRHFEIDFAAAPDPDAANPTTEPPRR